MRDTWTDERLDDLSRRMETGFDRVHQDLRDLNGRFDAFNQRMDERFESANKRTDERFEAANQRTDERFDAVDARFDSLQRTMLQIGGGMIAAFIGLIAAFIGLIATQI